MATSGTYNYSRTAAQIIQAAYEDLGVVAPGGTVQSADSTMALARLNMLVKRMQGNSDLAPGLKVWTRQRVTLFLEKGRQTYPIGPASTDARAATSYGRTTVATNYASGTSLVVTAITDTTTDPGTTVSMTSGDFIGVELNDGTIGWTTLNGTPGSTTVTLTAGFSVAANAGNYVYWFTGRAQRFPLIESAVLRDENRTDTPLSVYRDVREYEYGVADKYSDGAPTGILVEPQRITTRVTLDSQPTDVTDQIVMTVLYPAENYDSTSDDIAFPQEWYDYLHWELALALAPSKGRPWTKEMEMNRTSAATMARALNPEVSNLYFQCNA